MFGSSLKLMFGEQFKGDASIIKYLPWLNWQRAIVQSWNANVFRIRLRVDPSLTAIRLVNSWKTEYTFFWRYCVCVFQFILVLFIFYFYLTTFILDAILVSNIFFFSCRLLLFLCRFVCDLNVVCCCFFCCFGCY